MIFHLNLSSKQEEQLKLQSIKARQRGDWSCYQRVLALLSLGEGHLIEEVSSVLQIATSSLYNWLKQFLLSGEASLSRKQSPGRPAKLTQGQKKQLYEAVVAGPEACGFTGSCWRTPMLQEWIRQKWNVFYSVHYLSQLLRI